ncbi:hypothetical protein [Pseudomonas sp. SED1]|jgi:hypothetical protein|uniref:hypothetical protein n=1 Tax=Pseudomonas sp. SED1 TaxID=3056845 RepID=UPI00296EB8AF|nr:hypothetical protein [Pseudomonas sp. SED1]MDY0833204.1 hypothetical protein [Pseudomonas sp. SED1]
MRAAPKNSVTQKSSSKLIKEPGAPALTANQRRFLSAAMTTSVDEPSLLAGNPDKSKA